MYYSRVNKSNSLFQRISKTTYTTMDKVLAEILKAILIDSAGDKRALIKTLFQDTKTAFKVSDIRKEFFRNTSFSYRESTIRSIKLTISHFEKYFGVETPFEHVTKPEAERFIKHLKRCAPKGVTVYLRTINAVLNKLTEWDIIQENPFKKIKLQKKQQEGPVYLSQADLEKAIREIHNGTIRNIVLMAFNTGMRLNEIINLDWKSVNLNERIICVGDKNFTTKGKNQRIIPMSDQVTEILLEQQKKRRKSKTTDIVFGKSNGCKITGNYVSKIFKKAVRLAGLNKDLHFHSLRHSAASHLVQNGVSIYTIKEILGHSSITTTQIYSHVDLNTLRSAIKTFNNNNRRNNVL